MFAALFLPMPAVFWLMANQDRLGLQTLTSLVGIAWGGTYLLFNMRWVLWPCPRCGEQFRNLWKPLAGQCQHCGLRQWSAE